MNSHQKEKLRDQRWARQHREEMVPARCGPGWAPGLPCGHEPQPKMSKHVPEPDGGDRHKSERGWHSGTADSRTARAARSEKADLTTTSKKLGEQELGTGSRH